MTSRKNLLFIFFTLKDDLSVLSSFFILLQYPHLRQTHDSSNRITYKFDLTTIQSQLQSGQDFSPYSIHCQHICVENYGNQIWLAHQQRPVKVGSKLVVEGSNYGGQSSPELSHMPDIPVILELSFAHCAKRVSHVSIFKEWLDRMTLHDR